MEGLTLALVISLAGGLGAALRHVVDRVVEERAPGAAAGGLGTFVVNVSGSFLLGLVVGIVPTGAWVAVLGVGLLGGYTTFSTAMLLALQRSGERGADRGGRAGLRAAAMLLACVAAAALGMLVASVVGGGR